MKNVFVLLGVLLFTPVVLSGCFKYTAKECHKPGKNCAKYKSEVKIGVDEVKVKVK